MYAVHLRLIGKHVEDFLLVLNELVLRVLQMRHYERILTDNQHFRSNRASSTQNFREKESPHQPFFLSEDQGE